MVALVCWKVAVFLQCPEPSRPLLPEVPKVFLEGTSLLEAWGEWEMVGSLVGGAWNPRPCCPPATRLLVGVGWSGVTPGVIGVLGQDAFDALQVRLCP